jgi:hypothetical protein
MTQPATLESKYPASPPCTCGECVRHCARPGWWTVSEAAMAVDAGYGGRMMLEMPEDKSFGVLSPAFRGNEVAFALELYSSQGCTFLTDERCELHDTPFKPLECRVAHHSRRGRGKQCHIDIERDWNTADGRSLVVQWSKLTGFWDHVTSLRRSTP